MYRSIRISCPLIFYWWRNNILLLFLLLAISSACGVKKNNSGEALSPKIAFDVSKLDEQGLYGPADGRQSISYEFCIPNDPQLIYEVQHIDPTIQIGNSPGRIGCQRGVEQLCIGHTNQPNWRKTLLQLADLPYIVRIEQSFFE